MFDRDINLLDYANYSILLICHFIASNYSAFFKGPISSNLIS